MDKQEKNLFNESVAELRKTVKELQSIQCLQILNKPKKFLFYNFLAGAAKGVGFAVGASFVFGLIVWLLSKLTIIPFFGDLIINLLNYIQKTKMY